MGRILITVGQLMNIGVSNKVAFPETGKRAE
jgi:hypothetical protein